jgi:hypothetical protein
MPHCPRKLDSGGKFVRVKGDSEYRKMSDSNPGDGQNSAVTRQQHVACGAESDQFPLQRGYCFESPGIAWGI